jgi:LPS export ABC transporter protein LptC
MRKLKYRILWVSILVLGLAAACRNKDEIVSDFDFNKQPDLTIEDFIYSATADDGSKIWELKSDSAEKFDSEQKFLMNTIRLKLYEDGAVSSVLTARYGLVSYNGRDILARSNVILQTADRTLLYTETLRWDNDRKLMTTEDFVRIVKPNGDVLTGYGLEMDQRADIMKIKRKVSGIMKKNENKHKN